MLLASSSLSTDTLKYCFSCPGSSWRLEESTSNSVPFLTFASRFPSLSRMLVLPSFLPMTFASALWSGIAPPWVMSGGVSIPAEGRPAFPPETGCSNHLGTRVGPLVGPEDLQPLPALRVLLEE